MNWTNTFHIKNYLDVKWAGVNLLRPSQFFNSRSPFPILGVSGVLFLKFLFCIQSPVYKQTLIRHCILRCLIWVCTVFQGPKNETLGIKGLMPFFFIFEPPHDKTNKMACAPSKDSDQPGHPPSLIRVFAVCMKKAWVLSYTLSAQRRLIRLGECPGWSESSLGAHSFCWFCHEAAHLPFSTETFSHDWKKCFSIILAACTKTAQT